MANIVNRSPIFVDTTGVILPYGDGKLIVSTIILEGGSGAPAVVSLYTWNTSTTIYSGSDGAVTDGTTYTITDTGLDEGSQDWLGHTLSTGGGSGAVITAMEVDASGTGVFTVSSTASWDADWEVAARRLTPILNSAAATTTTFDIYNIGFPWKGLYATVSGAGAQMTINLMDGSVRQYLNSQKEPYKA